MRVLFRVDANGEIGAGHLMRCLALASALKARGAACTFLTRTAGLGAVEARIRDEGASCLNLPEIGILAVANRDGLAHSHWLPGGYAADVTNCKSVLGQISPADWLVVDHYALDFRWEVEMASYAKRVLVIDDLADRQHKCTLLLDQNLMPNAAQRYVGLVGGSCECLLGPDFALLRNEFTIDKNPATRVGDENKLHRMLVMFGGSDPRNLTMMIAKLLIAKGWRDPIDFVAGPLYPHLDELREALRQLPDACLHAPAHDVAALMKNARLAVGSPGVSSWERCACALPSITIAQADNQEPIGSALAQAGAHLYLGRLQEIDLNRLFTEISTLWSSPKRLTAMSAAAYGICDGKGTERVARRMEVNERHDTVF